MIQRKVSIKRVLTEIEREDLEVPSTDDLSVPEKPRRKTSKVSKEENPEESKTDSVELNDNAGDVTEDPSTKVSEVDKNDTEESESSKDVAEQDVQDSQSSSISGVDDSSQEASGALSKRLRMYKCERCNTQYMGLAMLRQHCRDVHGDQKYYKCHVCGKLFSHPSSRNIHLRLHSGEKPYKCSTCGKQFRVSSHLKDHVRVHTGERPYICDICQKGFKQSSDLKKHRRTHTLDKPYKCPICPSAFTRSHHCRGHINSVHKFFKCACSALFTSEEAFERHKELHPSVFPEQADGEETPPEVSGSAQKGSVPKDNTQEDNELHEKNLKLDVANQLLELHKIMQHRSSPVNTTGSGSETFSDSGDEGNSNSHSKQSPPSSEVKLVRPQPASSVSPVLRYENDSNRRSLNMSQMEQANILLPKITSESVEFHVPQARYCYSSQPNPQTVDYLRLPFQSISLAGNRKPSPQRKVGHVGVPSPERQKSPPSPQRRISPSSPQRRESPPSPQRRLSPSSPQRRESPPSPQRRISPSSPQRRESPPSPQRRKSPVDQSINGIHSAVHNVPQHAQCMPHFVMNVDPQGQNGSYSLYLENSMRAVDSPKDSVEVSKTAESVNTVPCHHVSVIQYHSSSPKPANDVRSEESSVQGTLQECDYKLSTLALSKPTPRTLANQSSSDQQQNHQMPQNYNLTMNNIKYLVGIPPERVPFVPHNAEHAMILQSWSKEMNEQVGKYTWSVKDEKNTHEQFLMREHALQFPYPKSSLESNQVNVFSQANAGSSRSLYNVHSIQERSADMLKYFAREQAKPKDAERDTGSSPGDDDSETSEASESGDVPNERKLSGSGGQLSPSSDSLAEQKDSSESSVHHCEVCNKTFSRSSLLKQHSVIHMGNKRFKFRCEVCGKMFRTRSHLRDHMRIHTGERPFKCHICQKAFKQSSDLKKHINLHTGANQFKCEECNMEFRRADALRKHKLGHKVGNMPCGHCGKNFLHIGALRAHRAMHNVQPVKTSRSFHRCNYCFKTFTKAESYKAHIEEHSREQGGALVLFDCKICSMKFFTEVEFQDHMNIHNGNRPYKCFVCDKEFCIAEHLQDHVRLHSDATSRVRCEEGSNRFQMPDDLMRHAAIHA